MPCPFFGNYVQTRPCMASRIRWEWKTNGFQISKVWCTKHGEGKKECAPSPSFPLLVLPDMSFVLFSISLRLKCWSPPFWKWCHFFFLPWQRASSLQICCVTDGFEEIRQRGKTHLGKVWNSRDRLTIKLAVRAMTKDKEKQRLEVNISSIFSFTVTEKLFLFPW